MDVVYYLIIWAVVFLPILTFGICADISVEKLFETKERGNGQREIASRLRWFPPQRDVDPVCNMTQQTATAKPADYNGLVHYVCSHDCRERFEATTETYQAAPANSVDSEKETVHG